MKREIGCRWALVAMAMGGTAAEAQESVATTEVWGEVGMAWQSRNEIQIPKATGTRFSLTDLGRGPVAAFRLYAGFQPFRGHEIRILAAPLSVRLKGTFSQDVSYQGKMFSKQQEVKALYRFDSYRLTYRYTLVDRDPFVVKVGFTGKIRDAEIRLEQAGRSAARRNTGFVPLLSFMASYAFNEQWEGLLDADALAAPQGRAEDVALLVGYKPTAETILRFGYRTVEGGSDGGGGDVYNFTWLHYMVAGAVIRF